MDFAKPRYVWWGERDEEANSPCRDGNPERAAGDREQDVLREQVSDDLCACRAERRSDHNLPHARHPAYDEKVGDVDARNQKQQARSGGESEERGADITNHQPWPRGCDPTQLALRGRRVRALQEGGQLVRGTRGRGTGGKSSDDIK